MGSLHNDLHSWAAKARRDGTETIVLDIATVDKIVDALTVAPADHVEVDDQWFTDSRLPVMAISGDFESRRILKLHFRRDVTNADRDNLVAAMNHYLRPPEPDAPGIERPISTPLRRSESDPAWMQVIKLFQQHGLPEPPVRLRDELVVALEWAWFGSAIVAAERAP